MEFVDQMHLEIYSGTNSCGDLHNGMARFRREIGILLVNCRSAKSHGAGFKSEMNKLQKWFDRFYLQVISASFGYICLETIDWRK